MALSDTRLEWFERLYDENYSAVLAYARRRSTDGDAEDVAAETFAVAWRRQAHVPEEETAWLIGVARRILANAARSERRRTALVERLGITAPAASWNPEVATPDPVLRHALEQLTDVERETLLLVAWEGLTPTQVAIAQGCTPTAARLRLHRARRHLTRALTPQSPATTATGALS